MSEKDRFMEIPAKQRMERQESLAREHTEEYKAALKRAAALNVPQAHSPSAYGTFTETGEEEGRGENSGRSSEEEVPVLSSRMRRKSWDELVRRLFHRDDSGQMVLRP